LRIGGNIHAADPEIFVAGLKPLGVTTEKPLAAMSRAEPIRLIGALE
jgi:hypothetical protein